MKNEVLQSGAVTPGHLAGWVTDGVVQDVGVSVVDSNGDITIITLPAGGTVGQSLTKNSSTNYDASWSFPLAPFISSSMLGTVQKGFDISQTISGFAASPWAPYGIEPFNNIIVTEESQANTGALMIYETVSTTGWTGVKTGINAAVLQLGTPSGGTLNQIVAGTFTGLSAVPAGVGSQTVFALNPSAILSAGATGYVACVGAEFDIAISSTASAASRIGIQVISTTTATDNGIQGSSIDAAYIVGTDVSAAKWKDGFYLYANSIDTGGTIFGSQGSAGTVTNGIDVSNFTLTGSAFKSSGFSVDGSGNVLLGNGNAIKWNSDAVSVTQTGTILFFAGATGYAFDKQILPSTNDGASLGVAGLEFSDLFLASGGIIDWNSGTYTLTQTDGSLTASGGFLSASASKGVGYTTGAGGTVTQITSRTTGVEVDTISGAITMFSAAGSATPATFTVTNSAVAATDTIIVNQKSGTNLYLMHVTAVAAGSFNITFQTTGGTATDAPVINFNVIKGAAS